MKCLNCGARIKKNEEICPGCGAYISRDKKPAVLPVQTGTKKEITVELLEKAIENTENTTELEARKFNFSNYLVFPSIIRIGGGIVLMVASVVSFASRPFRYITSSVYSLIFCILASLFFVFKGIASIIQERKCVLDVTSEKVSGTIPLGFFDAEAIDINIEDIIAVNEKDFHSKRLSAEVHIITKEKEYVVRSSSQDMLLDLSNTLQNTIKKLKGESE